MSKIKIHKILTYLIAAVWLINGLFAKVLNFVPRHAEIVSRILGDSHSHILIKTIGIAEIFMAIWILSRIKSSLNAATQIIIIAAMNILEFLLAPDLLLFGRANIVIALMFIAIIYYNEFALNKDFS